MLALKVSNKPYAIREEEEKVLEEQWLKTIAEMRSKSRPIFLLQEESESWEWAIRVTKKEYQSIHVTWEALTRQGADWSTIQRIAPECRPYLWKHSGAWPVPLFRDHACFGSQCGERILLWSGGHRFGRRACSVRGFD